MASGDVRAKLAELRPSEEDLARVQRAISSLSAMLGELGPGWRVSPFGSAANGFSTRNSDLDVTCHRDEGALDEEENAADRLLAGKVLPLLRACPKFSIVEEILFARVPILKLRFEDDLEVDLSCNNTKPLENTRLLHAYAGFDARVRDLGIAVKTWAKAAQVSGASQSHLSSYAFTLLAIYYMQVAPSVRLPRLPPQAFKEGAEGMEDERVQAARSGWSCTQSLEQLLANFFQFYVHEFHWGSEVVSVRFGERLRSEEILFNQLKGRQLNRLHVEDPCDHGRNLNCVLGKLEEQHLYAALKDAWLALHDGRAPLGLGAAFRGSQQKQSQSEVGAAPPDYRDAAADGQAPSESTQLGSYGSAESTASGSESPAASAADRGKSPATSTPALTPAAAPAAGKKIIECGDLEAALLASQAEDSSMDASPWWQNFMDSGAKAAASAGGEERRRAAPQGRKDGTWLECGDFEAKIAASKAAKKEPTKKEPTKKEPTKKEAAKKEAAKTERPAKVTPVEAAEIEEPAADQARRGSGQGLRENRPLPLRRSRMGRMGPRAPHESPSSTTGEDSPGVDAYSRGATSTASTPLIAFQ
jgi:hypothetical protein